MGKRRLTQVLGGWHCLWLALQTQLWVHTLVEHYCDCAAYVCVQMGVCVPIMPDCNWKGFRQNHKNRHVTWSYQVGMVRIVIPDIYSVTVTTWFFLYCVFCHYAGFLRCVFFQNRSCDVHLLFPHVPYWVWTYKCILYFKYLEFSSICCCEPLRSQDL